MTKLFEGKIALVTGASRGIGNASARRLAADGAHVLVHYGSSRDEAERLVRDIKDEGGSAEAIQADLSSAAGVESLVSQVKDRLGGKPLDILFNNAGIAEFVEFDATDAATLDRQYAVNVRAPFLLTQGLLDVLADGASVLVTSSIVAKTYFDGIPAYSITKGAVDTLVRHLAALLGPRNIRVNAVAPGAIDTDMSAWLRSDEGAANAKSIQALQRVGKPEDIAGVAAFLASNDAGWVTGQVIDASGGSKL
ncbi:SDR family NAD(P)-dependent oxidoreductase [Sphingomicrobium flavum]|uniref:SDR family NAD(P)-dependent oxidoreductase n=1 Tax=Sphingomicrobium flavum TaxID=1229164 RepID=UPI0021AD7558|nr:SDR family oxidoreductase [Sphingomicrobium flavum]